MAEPDARAPDAPAAPGETAPLAVSLRAAPARYGMLHTVSLPSGHKVRARRPSIYSLVVSGLFPSELANEVVALAREGFLPMLQQQDPEQLRRWAAMVEALVPHVLVDPKPSEVTEYTVDEQGVAHGMVHIADLTDPDKQHLFFFAQGFFRGEEEMAELRAREVVARDLAPFRDGPARGDAGPGGETVQSAPVESAGAAI